MLTEARMMTIVIISTPVRYHMAGEKLPSKHQLFIEFDDFTAITCTTQMWGCMFCFKDGDQGGIPFLATEQRIPGLGNGVLQDILWTAKIHPKRKMSSLSDDEIKRMYTAVKSVIGEMILMGGRDTERDLFGCPGGYVKMLQKMSMYMGKVP